VTTPTVVCERDRSNFSIIVLNKRDEKMENTLHECVCEIEKTNFDDYDNSDLLLIREPLGTSWSKEGADVEVGEGSPRKEPSHRK
jgi:hypothetical protein